MLNIIYTGSIRYAILPYVIDLFSQCKQDVTINFYGSNTLDLPKISIVKNYGLVSHEESLKAQESADALLSLALKGTGQIAAKIFEYMSSGKPIIHFYIDDYDPNIPYYNKYRNALCIDIKNDKNVNLKLLDSFLGLKLDKILYSELKNVFYMNTPNYTYKMITEFFK